MVPDSDSCYFRVRRERRRFFDSDKEVIIDGAKGGGRREGRGQNGGGDYRWIQLTINESKPKNDIILVEIVRIGCISISIRYPMQSR